MAVNTQATILNLRNYMASRLLGLSFNSKTDNTVCSNCDGIHLIYYKLLMPDIVLNNVLALAH